MTGLREVCLGVNAALTAALALLAIPAPTYRFGQNELARNDFPPRICWVPKRGRADGNFQTAPDHPSQFGVNLPPAPQAPVNPQPLWSRWVETEAHVWALRATPDSDPDVSKDYAAAEALANHLVAAVHPLMFGAYKVNSEDWTMPAPGGAVQASDERFGATLVVTFAFNLTWTRELDTYAVVTAIPITPGTERIGS